MLIACLLVGAVLSSCNVKLVDPSDDSIYFVGATPDGVEALGAKRVYQLTQSKKLASGKELLPGYCFTLSTGQVGVYDMGEFVTAHHIQYPLLDAPEVQLEVQKQRGNHV